MTQMLASQKRRGKNTIKKNHPLGEYEAIIEKHGSWYIGYIEGMGVNTQGRTLPEVQDNLKDALRLYLKTQQEVEAFMKKQENLRKNVVWQKIKLAV